MKLSACALLSKYDLSDSPDYPPLCNQAANPKAAVVMPVMQAKFVERMQRPVEESSITVSWSSLRKHVESHSKEIA